MEAGTDRPMMVSNWSFVNSDSLHVFDRDAQHLDQFKGTLNWYTTLQTPAL